jgi:hypothetical protein
VAVTRAQAMLIVVGDPQPLHIDKLWHTFLNYIILNGGRAGKDIDWDPSDEVMVPRYQIIPRQQPVYGDGIIDGKSVNIYRYNGT